VKPRAGTGIGLVKNKTPRTIELAAETVALLRAHRAHQAEIKDGEPHDLSRALGDPLQMGTLGRREFGRPGASSSVGLRRTCATLLLQVGVPPQVVQQRLGHMRIGECSIPVT